MIAGIFHPGSGVGNQLHRYVATRVLALDKRKEFGMIAPENFKGASFMNLDMGVPVECTWTIADGGKLIPISSMTSYEEKKIVENGVDIRSYDPEFAFIKDNTIIDGEFQDKKYFMHRINEVNRWLSVEPLGVSNDVCVMGFRGGEYTAIPELFLPAQYWTDAMSMMKAENHNMKFIAVTDDPDTARKMLPEEVLITHNEDTDWRMIRYARYLIIANSSFYILPALLNYDAKKIIAPRYWARRNTGGPWSMGQNYYRQFTYI